MKVNLSVFLIVAASLILTVPGCDLSEGSTSANREKAAGAGDSSSFSITVNVDGADIPGTKTWAHVCWIEDESEQTIQHISVTTRANPNVGDDMSGTGMPIWSRPGGGAMYEHPDDVDAVTRATQDGAFEIQEDLSFDTESVREFRILFEVDRSFNGNDYFPKDRPSFLYRTELIDLDSIDPEGYSATLYGWMCNDTVGTNASWDQGPGDLADFPFFDSIDDVSFNFRTELEYIANTGSDPSEPIDVQCNDMINGITVYIAEH